MPHRFPLNTDKAPNAVLEVILRLKVKDAMSKTIFSAKKNDNLRQIQHIMRDKGVTGIPILEDDRLIGMISVNDIISALDYGYINEPADNYMTKSLIVLEDDMPLSFAVSYFDKYPYRRFPVINKEKKFVGMISSRDVLSALLHELNNEITELENKLNNGRNDVPGSITREYSIQKFDFENAGKASFELKKILKGLNASRQVVRRASVASYELEINIAIHSNGGKMRFEIDESRIIIDAVDFGSGIEDVDLVLQEGYSTANEWIRSMGFGAGMGLSNTKRVADEFEIQSELGKGTHIKSIIYLGGRDEA